MTTRELEVRLDQVTTAVVLLLEAGPTTARAAEHMDRALVHLREALADLAVPGSARELHEVTAFDKLTSGQVGTVVPRLP